MRVFSAAAQNICDPDWLERASDWTALCRIASQSTSRSRTAKETRRSIWPHPFTTCYPSFRRGN